MEKRIWSKPEMNEFAFAANEYVAACGDENKKYLFECNAGREDRYYNVFLNGDDGMAETEDDIAWAASEWYSPVENANGKVMSSYHPCLGTHEAPVADIFKKGYMFIQGLFGFNSGKRIDVFVWTDNDTNVHCTENLDINSWTTAKS